MSHQQVENFTLFALNEKFNGIWKLTRALKTAGWRYKASANATTKDSTGNPNNDTWGGGVQVGGQTGGGGFTIGAPTSTAFGGRSVITNLPGAAFAATSVGHFLKIVGAANAANNGTWLITNFNSATSVTIENPAAVPETVGVGGGQSWTELSALLDTYPASLQGATGQGAWWVGQGPSTLKVPIGTSTPTGTFIRGENVTQSSTGCTAEFLGVATDPAGGNGLMVLSPRLSGTGAGVRGWSSLPTGTITGDKSGASTAPTATIIEYVREVVFWKNTATLGHIYFQVIDSVNESTATATTGRFSVLAAGASSTATLAPGGNSGGNPTTNGFPTVGTYVIGGTGGPGVVTTGSQDLFTNTQSSVNGATQGLTQILCANMIEDSLVSADGTFTLAVGSPATSVTAFFGFGFHRVDDQEPGDVDPYVWMSALANTAYARTRTAGGTPVAQGEFFNAFQYCNFITYFLGWKRRGYATGDSWIEMGGAVAGTFGGVPVMLQNASTPDRVACSFVNIAVREPIWVYSAVSVGNKMRKGTLRWWFTIQTSSTTVDTYDTKRWIGLSVSGNGPTVVGPADGTTTPTNQ
jgi:hypothetical protein